MGDTGAMAIGGALAAMAIFTQTISCCCSSAASS